MGPWWVHGSSIMCSWRGYRSVMGPWWVYGASVVYTWCLRRAVVGFRCLRSGPWCVHSVFVRRWCPDGASMVLRRAFEMDPP